MPEYIDRCKKCSHFQVCANVMKNQLFIREKMLLEENPECEHFISDADVAEVVRCSECKYFGKELKQGKHSCLNYQLPYCLENDYCGYGERKDGDKK